MLGTPDAGAPRRSIFFYLSNEGISILENTAHLGLPIRQTQDIWRSSMRAGKGCN